MSAINITVEAGLGRSVMEVIETMATVARRIGIDVWCPVNGVKLLVRPGDAPQATYTAWEKALQAGHSHASAERDNQTRVPR